MTGTPSPAELVRSHGGRYAAALGIDLAVDSDDTTAAIFLRELRGIWSKAAPQLSPLALAAAQELGYLRHGRVTAETALSRLQQAWANDGQAAQSFANFEAALVRVGLRLRRAGSRHRQIR